MLGEIQKVAFDRWVLGEGSRALARCIVLAWLRSGQVKSGEAQAGGRAALVAGGVVGVDDALRDAPALGDLAPAGPGPFADGAGLLPARAAGAPAPRAAADLAGGGSELGQLLFHACLVLLRQVDLISRVSQRDRYGAAAIRAVEVIHDQSFRRHDDIVGHE